MNPLFVREAVLGLVLTAGQAFAADCSHDEAPALPDGATSTVEQMVEAQGQVKSYVASVEDYLACMDAAIEQIEDEDAKAEMISVRNTVFDEMEGIANGFNDQIKAYKKANP